MNWLFDDDDQIFEDDEALRREFLARDEARRCAFSSSYDVDNDYEGAVGFAGNSDLMLSW